jgi:hypothetical protein
MIGFRSTFFPTDQEKFFVHSYIVLGFMNQYLGAAVGKVISLKANKILVYLSDVSESEFKDE